MKKITEVINLLKNKEIIKKYNLTEIEVLSYIYLIYEGKNDLLLTTHTLIYPNKKVRVKSRSHPLFIDDQKINEENELWQFIFYVECFGKNLDELKEYIENNFKESIGFISTYHLFDDHEKLSVEFKINFEKLKYF